MPSNGRHWKDVKEINITESNKLREYETTRIAAMVDGLATYKAIVRGTGEKIGIIGRKLLSLGYGRGDRGKSPVAVLLCA